MSFWDATYEMAKDAPPAMDWEDYSHRVMVEWSALLNSSDACAERPLQAFLESHPCMVPGPFSTSGGGDSGHYPHPYAVITQPPLRGLTTRVPDFMWIATDSATISPVLVEIERPSKRWFVENGQPSAELTQAQNQLAEWRTWMAEPSNRLRFREFYAIHDDEWHQKTFSPEYILVFGRRSEFDGQPELNKKRRALERANERYMTFDRLEPHPKAAELLCVRVLKARQFTAITWPPVAQLGPLLADARASLDGVDEAIRKAAWITEERRQFLLERLPYWNSWRRTTLGIGPISLALE